MKLSNPVGALAVGALALSTLALVALGQDPAFSGPQVGEPITGFVAVGTTGDARDQELDFVERFAGATTVYCFMHEISRATGKAIRALDEACSERGPEGLESLFVVLGKDQDAAERYGMSLPGLLELDSTVAVCKEGVEGPGAWGLDNSLALTVVVARDDVVVGNFALLGANATDVPRIMEVVDRALVRVESFSDVERELARLRAEVRELRGLVEQLQAEAPDRPAGPGAGAGRMGMEGDTGQRPRGRGTPRAGRPPTEQHRAEVEQLTRLLKQLTSPGQDAQRTAADLAQVRALLEQFPDLAGPFRAAERKIAADGSGTQDVRDALRALARRGEDG